MSESKGSPDYTARAREIVNAYYRNPVTENAAIELHHTLAAGLQDAYALGQETMRETCARLVETRGYRSSSIAPHHSLAPDSEPDVVRREYTRAIRALPITPPQEGQS